MNYRDIIRSNVIDIRLAVEDLFLQDTALFHSKTGENIARGMTTIEYATPVEILCRIIVKSGSESEKLAAQGQSARPLSYIDLLELQVPFDLDIKQGDLIELIDIVTSASIKFDVIYVPVRNELMSSFVIQLQARK